MKLKMSGLVLVGALLVWCMIAQLSLSVGAGQKQPTAEEKLPFTDQEIRVMVYDKTYTTPPGFYADPVLKDAANSLYYHQPGWFATDKDKARKIVADFLIKPGVGKDKKIEETNATKKFFDFRAGKVWYRVHNPDYFTPKGPQLDTGLSFLGGAGKPEVIGTLKFKPVTAAAVKELAEYLWLIRFHNVAGAKVLSSQATENDGVIVANFVTTQVVFGDFGVKDEISVVKESYQVNGMTGIVTYRQQVLRTLTGKQNK